MRITRAFYTDKKKSTKKISVLVSNKGTGSNLKALLKEKFNVILVVADREEAAGIDIAKENNIHFKVLPYKRPVGADENVYRNQYSRKLADVLNNNKIDVAVLAGFNRIITKPYFETFRGKTINIHPGAIPDDKNLPYIFPDKTVAPWNQGMLTDKAVENFLPLKYASSTIHVVTEEADYGPVLERVIVDVKRSDNVETLYDRLKKAEHKGLIKALKNL